MSGMPSLDHVTVVAADFARSLAFYDAVFGALGMPRAAEFGDEEEDDPQLEAAGWANEGQPVLWLVGGPAPTERMHVSLRADSRDDVERFFAAAIGAGGAGHGIPRRWPIYRRGEYAAIVDDPDGNTIEVVAPE